MPTFSISLEKVGEHTPFFFNHNVADIEFSYIESLSFDIEQTEVDKIQSLITQYALHEDLLVELLWFYDKIKNAHRLTHDYTSWRLTGYEENADILELAERKGKNWPHRELLFGFEDEEINKKIVANLKQYELLKDMIIKHKMFYDLAMPLNWGEVQKISFHSNTEKVEISQPALIDSILESILSAVNTDVWITRLDQIIEERLDRVIKQSPSERRKRLLAYYLHRFLSKETTLSCLE